MTNTPDDDDRGPSSVFDSDDVVFTDRRRRVRVRAGRGHRPRSEGAATPDHPAGGPRGRVAPRRGDHRTAASSRGPAPVPGPRRRRAPRHDRTAARAEGYDAQPNHVFFSHGCDCCTVHPADTFDMVRSGGWASPLHANPMRTNPMRSNPMRTNPMRSNSEFQDNAVPALPSDATTARTAAVPARRRRSW